MIVQHTTEDGEPWRCLARRGMLHSECEAVDLLDVPPGGSVVHRDADGVDEAFYVVSGAGEVSIAAALVGAAAYRVTAGALALVQHDVTAVLRAGPEGLRLVAIRVLPAATSADLPLRVPQLPPAERTLLAHHS
ncbi:hypothetical protein ABT297_39970 [Dactylosporangium sp. NPDC000555]|uniref:hypothetical protein n=1 Tax=Dactylosporangium sp. NPDC000555 TaxID=3154260 RepID=UPI003327DBA4